DLAEGGVGAQVDGEALESFLDRLLAVVAQRHRLTVGVVDDETLDQVVDVGRGELQIDAGIAVDVAAAVKVPDAAVEQDDLGNGELLRRLESIDVNGDFILPAVLRLGIGTEQVAAPGEHAGGGQ